MKFIPLGEKIDTGDKLYTHENAKEIALAYKSRMLDLIKKSNKINKEIGFTVCETNKGNITTTDNEIGDVDGINLPKCQKNIKRPIGFFHTHPRSVGEFNITPSFEDIYFTIIHKLLLICTGSDFFKNGKKTGTLNVHCLSIDYENKLYKQFANEINKICNDKIEYNKIDNDEKYFERVVKNEQIYHLINEYSDNVLRSYFLIN